MNATQTRGGRFHAGVHTRRRPRAMLAPVSTGWVARHNDRTCVNITAVPDGVLCWEKRVYDGIASNTPLYRGRYLEDAVEIANEVIGELVDGGYHDSDGHPPQMFTVARARAALRGRTASPPVAS